MHTSHAPTRSLGLFALLTCGLACATPTAVDDPAPPDPGSVDPASDATGEVVFELTTVPTGAQCLRVTAVPAIGNSVSQSYGLVAGSSSANLSLAGLPQGALSMSANVYNAACSSLGSAAPTWIADPVS